MGVVRAQEQRATLAIGNAWLRLRARDEFGVLVTLAALVILIGVARPRFLAAASLTNVATGAAFFGLMALGMVFVLSMRDVDLSVGSIYGLTLTVAALLMQGGLDPWIAALAGIVLGIVCGLLNGLITNILKIPAIIVTLGTLSIYRGVCLVLADGREVSGLPREAPFFSVLGRDIAGLPAIVWALIILTPLLSLLYRSTRFGFVVRAIGSNPAAAVLSGISIERYRLAVLGLAGGLCGLTGVLTLAFFGSAHPSVGQGSELFAIAAAIIGGTGLAGGTGTVIGAALGALIVAIIRSGLVQFGITANWSTVATGVVIIAAVALDNVIRRRREQGRRLTSARSASKIEEEPNALP